MEQSEELIAIKIFCECHEVEYSFVDSLETVGLIELTPVNDQKFIQHSQLSRLEQLTRLHNDLDINISGIEAIVNMLDRIDSMKQHITELENRLRFYES